MSLSRNIDIWKDDIFVQTSFTPKIKSGTLSVRDILPHHQLFSQLAFLYSNSVAQELQAYEVDVLSYEHYSSYFGWKYVLFVNGVRSIDELKTLKYLYVPERTVLLSVLGTIDNESKEVETVEPNLSKLNPYVLVRQYTVTESLDWLDSIIQQEVQ